jgi:3-phosphoshikimate 1-carboxyvinyltransferase
MPDTLELVTASRSLRHTAHLPASKSISNRLLLLQALSQGRIVAHNLSAADDTQKLQHILQHLPAQAHAGHGGTTFRFALAALAATPEYSGVLDGSARLRERPQGILIDALRSLGASIECLQHEGFAPVRIHGRSLKGGTLHVEAGVSSQFLSALALVAPFTREGIRAQYQGTPVSLSYLEMSFQLLEQCGIRVEHSAQGFEILPQTPASVKVSSEPDWSSAAYWYSFAALSDACQIRLPGVSLHSMQPDAACAALFTQFGVETLVDADGLLLQRKGSLCDFFAYDALQTPDLAMSLIVTCAALGIPGHITGLQTLQHKESRRLQALQTELAKLRYPLHIEGDHTVVLPARHPDFSRTLIAETYHDHRMALCLSPLVMKCYRLAIRNPEVVNKSYPHFWREVREAGIRFAEWEG